MLELYLMAVLVVIFLLKKREKGKRLLLKRRTKCFMNTFLCILSTMLSTSEYVFKKCKIKNQRFSNVIDTWHHDKNINQKRYEKLKMLMNDNF